MKNASSSIFVNLYISNGTSRTKILSPKLVKYQKGSKIKSLLSETIQVETIAAKGVGSHSENEPKISVTTRE